MLQVYFWYVLAFGIYRGARPPAARARNGEQRVSARRCRYWFFQKNTGRVEVVRGGRLELVYFPRPVISNFLTDSSREAFKWAVDRSSPQAKLDGLVAASEDFLAEMRHQAYIWRSSLVAFASGQLEALKTISFALALAINAIVLLSYGVALPTTGDMSAGDMAAAVVNGGDSLLGGPGSAGLIVTLGLIQ